MRKTIDIPPLRSWVADLKSGGLRVGLVPTMGSLHEGHLSLVDLAKEKSDAVVMSIFVNPTQFGPDEDYERYPRNLERDLELAEKRGVDIAFCPDVDVMYPGGGSLTYVDMHRLPDPLCGAMRPGHFQGVMTVVTKLLNIVEPDVAVFGQKDIQQLIIIEQMVRDLNLPVDIVTGRTIREEDGLALSSRNSYLSEKEREDALCLYRALLRGKELISLGERRSEKIIEAMGEVLRGETIKVDYVSVVQYENLEKTDQIREKTVVAVAAFVGSTRLIDNFIVDFTENEPSFHL